MNNLNMKTISMVSCAVLGCLFVLLFSYSTSPIYPDFYGGDTSQFLTVGKVWWLGKVPYRDIFDHKGPLIFFVDMLGFMITGTERGVFLIQILLIVFTVFSFFSIGFLYRGSNIEGIICALLSLLSMKANYSEGNSVEEYCVPFICWSMYGLLKYYLKHRGKQHDFRWAFFYGVTFGICFLTRITNYIAVVALLSGVILFLILNKEYKNLFVNGALYILGIACTVLPFCIYFYYENCFDQFIYGTFTYNVEYAIKINEVVGDYINEISLKTYLYRYYVYYIVFAISLICYLKKDYVLAVVFLISGLLETYLFMTGSSFFQYPLVCIGQISIFLNELISYLSVKKAKRDVFFGGGVLFALVFVVFLSITVIRGAMEISQYRETCAVHTERPWEALVREIPDNERDSFVANGANALKEVYLVSGLIPAYKYFIIQDWHAKFSETVRKEYRDIYAKGDVKWILTDGSIDEVRDIIEERYHVYATKDGYSLYRMNE